MTDGRRSQAGDIRQVEVIQVIRTKVCKGTGRDASSVLREVTQIWSMDGELIATYDPCPDKADGSLS